MSTEYELVTAWAETPHNLLLGRGQTTAKDSRSSNAKLSLGQAEQVMRWLNQELTLLNCRIKIVQR